MKTSFCSLLTLAALATASHLLAQGFGGSAPRETVGSSQASIAGTSQSGLEAKFKATFTNATLTGRWCSLKNGVLGPDKEDKYTIVGVTKQGGDNWIIQARIQYNDKDIVAPIPATVKWAGDAAVLIVDHLQIPSGGTYSARVLIYENTYAGTWNAGEHGGLLSGVITNATSSGGK